MARYSVAFTDAVIEFDFRLDGAKAISLSLNDKTGHVCRLSIRPTGFQVAKDDHDHDGPDQRVVLADESRALKPGTWYHGAGRDLRSADDGSDRRPLEPRQARWRGACIDLDHEGQLRLHRGRRGRVLQEPARVGSRHEVRDHFSFGSPGLFVGEGISVSLGLRTLVYEDRCMAQKLATKISVASLAIGLVVFPLVVGLVTATSPLTDESAEALDSRYTVG